MANKNRLPPVITCHPNRVLSKCYVTLGRYRQSCRLNARSVYHGAARTGRMASHWGAKLPTLTPAGTSSAPAGQSMQRSGKRGKQLCAFRNC
jgi:hypothetical protein